MGCNNCKSNKKVNKKYTDDYKELSKKEGLTISKILRQIFIIFMYLLVGASLFILMPIVIIYIMVCLIIGKPMIIKRLRNFKLDKIKSVNKK